MAAVCGVVCVAAMFVISWPYAVVSLIGLLALAFYVWKRKPDDMSWGAAGQQHKQTLVRNPLLFLYMHDCNSLCICCFLYGSVRAQLVKWLTSLNTAVSSRTYRPHPLVLVGAPQHRPALARFAKLLTRGNGVVRAVEVYALVVVVVLSLSKLF